MGEPVVTFPITNISGSIQCPGPPKGVHSASLKVERYTDVQESLISGPDLKTLVKRTQSFTLFKGAEFEIL